MIESLLVPLDGSELSERSLAVAGDLARHTGARLHVAHVHVSYVRDQLRSSTQFQLEGVDLVDYDERHRREERSYLERIVVKLSTEGTGDVEVTLLEGHVAREIAAYAKRVEADAILMTTRGYAGMSRLRLGSVTDALIRETTLPIVVLHPGRNREIHAGVQPFRHVFVTLDGSLLAESILAPATDLARAQGARITLFNAVSPGGVPAARLLPVQPDSLMPRMEERKDYLERVARSVRGDGVEVDVQVVGHESPARAIVEAADRSGADLIAIATHGYGGLRRALLGSVADEVLHATSLPLLVKKPV